MVKCKFVCSWKGLGSFTVGSGFDFYFRKMTNRLWSVTVWLEAKGPAGSHSLVGKWGELGLDWEIVRFGINIGGRAGGLAGGLNTRGGGGYEESVNVRAVDFVGALGGWWGHLPSGWVHLYEISSSVWGLAKLGGFPKHSSGVGTWTLGSGACSGEGSRLGVWIWDCGPGYTH